MEALAAAVAHRHTSREPFARTPIPAPVLDQLRDAARREGAVLGAAGPAARDAILRLAHSADRMLHDRPGYGDELGRWATDGARLDGVPLSAAGPSDPLASVPIRDFAELSGAPRSRDEFEPYPTILVLATPGDRDADRVRAGQALQRVLLTATGHGLATMPISQPIEVAPIRRLLIEADSGLTAQMVLRVGYGRPTGGTPRRPLAEVLLPTRRS